MNKALIKRIESLELAHKQAIDDKYMQVVVIRHDEDLQQYEGQIGKHTNIIKIVPRLERVK